MEDAGREDHPQSVASISGKKGIGFDAPQVLRRRTARPTTFTSSFIFQANVHIR